MITKKLNQIFSLIIPGKRDYVVKYSTELRREAENRIDDMVADLNGCTDEWFLIAETGLDECVQKDEDL